MATGLALAVVSIWHGIASILHEDYQRKADIVMLCVFSASYFIYNCQYIGRIFFGVRQQSVAEKVQRHSAGTPNLYLLLYVSYYHQ